MQAVFVSFCVSRGVVLAQDVVCTFASTNLPSPCDAVHGTTLRVLLLALRKTQASHRFGSMERECNWVESHLGFMEEIGPPSARAHKGILFPLVLSFSTRPFVRGFLGGIRIPPPPMISLERGSFFPLLGQASSFVDVVSCHIDSITNTDVRARRLRPRHGSASPTPRDSSHSATASTSLRTSKDCGSRRGTTKPRAYERPDSRAT